jgi:hypothetical protein
VRDIENTLLASALEKPGSTDKGSLLALSQFFNPTGGNRSKVLSN